MKGSKGISSILVVTIVVLLLVLTALLTLAMRSYNRPQPNQTQAQATNNPGQTNVAPPSPQNSALSGIIFGADDLVQGRQNNSALISQLGIKINTVWLYMDNYTSHDTGPLNTNQVLSYLNSLQSLYGSGVELTLHVMPPRPNCSGGLKAGCKAMLMPSNMNLWDQNLTSLAQTLKGRVRFYAIGNEVSGVTFTGSVSDYYDTLLPQSYSAIKKGDPTATVLDGAQASEVYGLVIAQDMVNKGQTQQAVDFLNSFYQYHSGPLKTYLPVTTGNINSMLDSNVAQETVPYVAPLFSSSTCSNYDVYELHYYAPWTTLQQTVDWIKSQMQGANCVKPMQVWELGYGLDNAGSYNANDHAQSVSKLLTLSAANNIGVIIYFPVYSRGTYAQPLIGAGGQTPSTAYQITATKLAGATAVSTLNLGANVFAYKFTTPSGTQYVLWSSESSTATLPTTSVKSAVDYLGNSVSVNPQSVNLTTSPVFISAAN